MKEVAKVAEFGFFENKDGLEHFNWVITGLKKLLLQKKHVSAFKGQTELSPEDLEILAKNKDAFPMKDISKLSTKELKGLAKEKYAFPMEDISDLSADILRKNKEFIGKMDTLEPGQDKLNYLTSSLHYLDSLQKAFYLIGKKVDGLAGSAKRKLGSFVYFNAVDLILQKSIDKCEKEITNLQDYIDSIPNDLFISNALDRLEKIQLHSLEDEIEEVETEESESEESQAEDSRNSASSIIEMEDDDEEDELKIEDTSSSISAESPTTSPAILMDDDIDDAMYERFAKEMNARFAKAMDVYPQTRRDSNASLTSATNNVPESPIAINDAEEEKERNENISSSVTPARPAIPAVLISNNTDDKEVKQHHSRPVTPSPVVDVNLQTRRGSSVSIANNASNSHSTIATAPEVKSAEPEVSTTNNKSRWGKLVDYYKSKGGISKLARATVAGLSISTVYYATAIGGLVGGPYGAAIVLGSIVAAAGLYYLTFGITQLVGRVCSKIATALNITDKDPGWGTGEPKENKLQAQLETEKSTTAALTSENRDIKAENRDVKAENQDIKAESQSIKDQLEVQTKELKALKEEKAHLESQLQSANRKSEVLQAAVQGLTQATAMLTQTNTTLTQTNNRLSVSLTLDPAEASSANVKVKSARSASIGDDSGTGPANSGKVSVPNSNAFFKQSKVGGASGVQPTPTGANKDKDETSSSSLGLGAKG